MTAPPAVETRVIDLEGLQSLMDTLVTSGYTVLGPTVRDGSIVTAPVRRVADLPQGWGDEQGSASYRLRRRDDDAVFGFAAGAQSAKPVFLPAEALLWRGRRDGASFTVEPDAEASGPAEEGPYALLGVRSCDLCAIGIQDTALADRPFADAHYRDARAGAFLVAVTCSDPGGTCFCSSMDTGPRPQLGRGAAFDLALTELLGDEHRFLVEVGTERGAEVLSRVPSVPAPVEDVDAADAVTRAAQGRMGRELDTTGLKELLYASVDSPHWDDVAARCLSCTNCTAVCPTCFCTTVQDVSDLTGDLGERHRLWDSCFNADFSYIHGGTVRESTRSRYRQWMTHKLAAWVDQFGTSGCVGCGRCVTWCPAGIDITAEVAALRGDRPAGQRHVPQTPRTPQS